MPEDWRISVDDGQPEIAWGIASDQSPQRKEERAAIHRNCLVGNLRQVPAVSEKMLRVERIGPIGQYVFSHERVGKQVRALTHVVFSEGLGVRQNPCSQQ